MLQLEYRLILSPDQKLWTVEKKKKVGILTLAVLAVLILLVFGTRYINNRIESKISGKLGQDFRYEHIESDLWQKQLVVKGLSYRATGKSIEVEKITADGIDYLDYLFSNQIAIDQLLLEEPRVQIKDQDSQGTGLSKKISRKLLINTFRATNGSLDISGTARRRKALHISFPSLELSEVKVDSSTLDKKIPFDYAGYEFIADSLRLNLNAEHYIAAGNMEVDTSELRVEEFRIIPYYTKRKFDRTVGYEKDRISLRVDSVHLNTFDFGLRQDTLYLETSLMNISGANLQIYRNRLLPDNKVKKPLYSQLIRNAPVKMNLEKVNIDDTRIVYEEKKKKNRPVAKVGFYEINGTLTNLTNMKLDREDFPRTKIVLESSFLKVAPLAVEWSFNINSPEDKFTISGDFGTVPASAMNQFLRPMRNMEAEGKLGSVSFAFKGDDDRASGDMRMKYDKFRIQLLEDEGKDEQEFFSALANLFVDNDGYSGPVLQENIEVKRDLTRSFWNYIWKGLQKGLIEGLSQI